MLTAIMLDTFCERILNPVDAPFLSAYAQQTHARRLLPTLGFNYQYSWISGVTPEQANKPFYYALNPSMASETDNSLNQHFVSQKLFAREPNQDPLLPKEFNLSFPAACRDRKTLFELAEEQGKSCLAFPYPDYRNIEQLEEMGVEALSEPDFLYLHIPDLDMIAHQESADSSRFKTMLKRIDGFLQSLIEARQGQVMIFGDHGAVDVEETVDLMTHIEEFIGQNSQPGDVTYFIDLTFVRFWGEPSLINDLTTHLQSRLPVTELTRDRLKESGFENIDERFGQRFVIANKGVIFEPNAFKSTFEYKSSHGYLPEVIENHSLGVFSDLNNSENPSNFVDLYYWCKSRLEQQ